MGNKQFLKEISFKEVLKLKRLVEEFELSELAIDKKDIELIRFLREEGIIINNLEDFLADDYVQAYLVLNENLEYNIIPKEFVLNEDFFSLSNFEIALLMISLRFLCVFNNIKNYTEFEDEDNIDLLYDLIAILDDRIYCNHLTNKILKGEIKMTNKIKVISKTTHGSFLKKGEVYNASYIEGEEWLIVELETGYYGTYSTSLFTIVTEEELQLYISEEQQKTSKFNIKKPSEIVKELDKYVFKNDKAKKQLALQVYESDLYAQSSEEEREFLPKANVIFLAGTTGCGKTLLAESLAKVTGKHFAKLNVNNVSGSGYVGGDLSDCLDLLCSKANGNIKEVENNSIVLLDECDKLVTKGTRGFSADTITKLLTMLEGEKIDINKDKKTTFSTPLIVDTSNIIFILAGSLNGIQPIIKERLRKSGKIKEKTLGFASAHQTEGMVEMSDEELIHHLKREDMIQLGFHPELVGRLNSVVVVDELTKDDIVEIMDMDTSVLSKYKKFFEKHDKELVVGDSTKRAIAEKVFARKLGARALNSIIKESIVELQMQCIEGEETELHLTTEMIVD